MDMTGKNGVGHTRVDIQPINGHEENRLGSGKNNGWLEEEEKEKIKREEEEEKKKKEDEEKKKKKEEEDKNRLPPVPFFKLERVVILVGLLAATLASLGMPGLFILFGEITDAFVDNSLQEMLDTGLANGGIEGNTQLKTLWDGLVQQNPSLSNLTLQEQEEYLRAAFSGGGSDYFSEVIKFGVGASVIGVALIILGYLFVATLNYTAEAQVFRVRGLFLNRILRQEIGWFDTRQTNDFASRVTEDLNKLQAGIGDQMGLYFFYTFTSLASLIIAFVYSWKLTLVVLAMFPLLAIAGGIMAKLQANLSTVAMDKYAKAGSVAEEVLSGIRTVVAFGGEEKEVERYDKNLKEAKTAGLQRGLVTGLGMGSIWLIMYASYALAFWYGTGLILEARRPESEFNMDPSTLVVVFFNVLFVRQVFFSVLMGAMNMGQSAPFGTAMTTAKAAASTVYDILERKSAIDPASTEGEKPNEVKGTIELREVHFNYPSRPEVKVLEGVNLRVQPGQTVALVGSSGCGKSTCIQLIQRFYDPLDGTVTLDGRDVRELNLGWLRDQIGVVGQEPVLFATTIAENIRYGRQGVSEADIQEAAKEANAHTFITGLPKQYETEVGDLGAQLSGGQKQRIAIARALVRQPRLLLLDEATSALDNQSEAIVQQALDKVRQGRTTVVVAHRLSTIRTADKIVAFDKGKVVEEGTHDELMSLGGLYHGLVNAQLTDEEQHSNQQTQHNQVEDTPQDIAAPPPPQDQTLAVDVEDEAMLRVTQEISDGELESVPSLNVNLTPTNSTTSPPSPPAPTTTSSTLQQRLITSAKSLFNYDPLKEEKDGQEVVDEDEQAALQVSIGQIMKLNAPEWPCMVVGVICAAIQGTTLPVYAILFGEVLGTLAVADESKAREDANMYSLIFLIMGIIVGITYFFMELMFALSGEEMTTRLRKESFGAMLKQEMAWFDDSKNSVGALCSRLSGGAADVQGVRDVLVLVWVEGRVGGATGSRLGLIIQSLTTVCIGVCLSLYYDWRLGLVSLPFMPFILACVYFQTKMFTGQNLSEAKTLDQASKLAVEAISNIRTVASLHREEHITAQYIEALKGTHQASVKKANVRGVTFGLANGLPIIAYGAILFYGGYLVKEGQMNFKNVFKVSEGLIMATMMVGQLVAFAPNYSKAKAAGGRVIVLLSRKPAIDTSPLVGSQLNGEVNEVGTREVHFNYPTRPLLSVLTGLTCEAKRGQVLALVGASGSGKSTVIALLQRFYDPYAGSVNINNEDLRGLQVGGVRSLLGLVSQEPTLFDRSVTENIVYGDNTRQVSQEEVVEAAKQANIHTFIESLPDGYETRVGQKGTQLSGGQKQRVAIARALVRNPSVLLLDEATSALDTESEKVVQEALEKAQKGRTCIVIAHRLSTIQGAHTIAVVQGGRVVESGSHRQLLELGGHYHALYHQSNKSNK
ncbi:hypothetical protein Pmani_034533 [Petrolisthes manimaculis]|uniref:ABC-type xenobiotic transporter n=1 Tax=Petrolisthes manimaculis TaxID=1843537 RepID=A0AAE1TPL0_9EUCA|nr:hypothetical protein Pmani_034533 [Petrolisthes manimaculis]